MIKKEIRLKLKPDFRKQIEYDTQLALLERIFDAINNEETSSLVSDEQYLKVDKVRREYFSGKSSANSWEEVERRLNTKYDF